MKKMKLLYVAIFFCVLNIASAEEIRWKANSPFYAVKITDVQVYPNYSYQYDRLTLRRGETVMITIKFYTTRDITFREPCRCYFLFMNQMIPIPDIQAYLYRTSGGYVANHEGLPAYHDYECSVSWKISNAYPLLDGHLIIGMGGLFDIRIRTEIDR